MADEDNLKYLEALGDPYFASPSRPLHFKVNSWDEETHTMRENIRSSYPFRDRWQTLIDTEHKLIIPEQLRRLVAEGGAVTVSTNGHLMLFGKRHWNLKERILSKQSGSEPIHTDEARHLFESVMRFDRLDENGAIEITPYLADYANLTDTVVIIGMVTYAEIHDRKTYMQTQTKEGKATLKDRFRGLLK